MFPHVSNMLACQRRKPRSSSLLQNTGAVMHAGILTSVQSMCFHWNLTTTLQLVWGEGGRERERQREGEKFHGRAAYDSLMLFAVMNWKLLFKTTSLKIPGHLAPGCQPNAKIGTLTHSPRDFNHSAAFDHSDRWSLPREIWTTLGTDYKIGIDPNFPKVMALLFGMSCSQNIFLNKSALCNESN